jgi:plastocyanin
LRTQGLIWIVAAATLTVAGCANEPTGSGVPSPSTPSPTASTPAVGEEINLGGLTTAYHGTAEVTGLQKVTIEMADHFFEPTVIHGGPGQELVLALENKSESSHTFTTADGIADIEVKPRSVAEGKITLPQSGNLLFFCRFHKDQGMVGLFNVSGPLDSPVPTVSARAT